MPTSFFRGAIKDNPIQYARSKHHPNSYFLLNRVDESLPKSVSLDRWMAWGNRSWVLRCHSIDYHSCVCAIDPCIYSPSEFCNQKPPRSSTIVFHLRLVSAILLLRSPALFTGAGSEVDAIHQNEVGDWGFKCARQYGAVWYQSGCLGVSISSLIPATCFWSEQTHREIV
jgi:hypothetical protein